MGELLVMLEVHFSQPINGEPIYLYPCMGQLICYSWMDHITDEFRVPNLRQFIPTYDIDLLVEIMDREIAKGRSIDEAASAVPPSDAWFDPGEAWKTINAVYQLALTRSPEYLASEIKDICDELAAECLEFRGLLEEAKRRDLEFRIMLEPAVDPSFNLVQWVQRENIKMCEEILEIFRDAGFGINEENCDD